MPSSSIVGVILVRTGFVAFAFGLLAMFPLRASAQEEAQPRTVACRLVPLPGHRVAFEYQGKPKLLWHFGKEYPRPFFYPLQSPAGTVLTRMGHPGAPNHDHHRSIWFAHHKVAGVNFWGDEGPNRGRVKQKQWLAYEDGDEEAIMAVLLGWYGSDERELMEQEVVAAWRPGGDAGHELELQLTFRPAGKSLELEKTNFGFLAVRMAKELSAHFGRGELRDSEGRSGEKAIFGNEARWMDYSGPTEAVPQGREGIAYFDHASNPNYPSGWHVRNDGWMNAGFCLKDGYTLTEERPLVLRYLLLAHSGNLTSKNLDQVANAFSKRPNFTVRKSKRPHRHYEVFRNKPK